MGSIDAPEWLKNKQKAAVTKTEPVTITGSIPAPDFLKKNKNLNGVGNSNQPLDISAPTELKSTESTTDFGAFPSFENLLDNNKDHVITTQDGVPFKLKPAVPYLTTKSDLDALQQRVINKTATPEDILILSRESGKSLNATNAYVLQDKDNGSAIEVTDNIAKANNDITNVVNYLNIPLSVSGIKLNADEIINSADKSSQLLSKIKQLQFEQQQKQSEDYSAARLDALVPMGMVGSEMLSSPSTVTPAITPEEKKSTDDAISALTYNIKKRTVDESQKAGLTNEETGQLLYQRLDPEGYSKNQGMRGSLQTDIQTKEVAGIISPIHKLNNFMDWIGNKDEIKQQALNVDKAQYELEANNGLASLAIEKKAQGVINKDASLMQEAETISKKVQPNSDIIQKYPLLMKQEMAQYVNERYAADLGILEGVSGQSQPTDASGHPTEGVYLTPEKVQRYLTEGGYFSKANYKDYAIEVRNNPHTYLADNSVSLQTLGISFLKPFKSIFNSAADLVGARNSTDRYTDAKMEEMFPSTLTQGVKEDISFNAPEAIGGFHVGTNVSNTMNSVANLGGYIAGTYLTAGIGAEAGLSANAASRMGAWATFGMDAVDTGLKEADKIGLTPAQSWLYAGMKATMMAEGGKLFEFGKGAVPEMAAVNESLVKAAKGISDKSLSEEAAKELLGKTSSAWVEGLKKYGIGTVKGAAVMSSFGIGDAMLRVGFGDKTVDTTQILPEAANAFFNGLFTMGIIGVPGIKGNIAEAKNSTYKGMLKKAVDNYHDTVDILNIGLEKGLSTPEEYDQKLRILNTGVKAKATLNEVVNRTGINLTQEQKSSWIANATVEKSLRNEANREGVSEADAKKYTEQADALSKQNSETLNGLTFDKFLVPQTELYDATQELKQAQIDFTTEQTPENEKALLQKKNAVDEINYNTALNEIERNRQVDLNELLPQVGDAVDPQATEINKKYDSQKSVLIEANQHLGVDKNGQIKKEAPVPDTTAADAAKKTATDLQAQNDTAIQDEIKTHEQQRDKEVLNLQKPEINIDDFKISERQLAKSKIPVNEATKKYKELLNKTARLKKLLECL